MVVIFFLIILEALQDVGIPGDGGGDGRGKGRVRDERRAAMDGWLAGRDSPRRKTSGSGGPRAQRIGLAAPRARNLLMT